MDETTSYKTSIRRNKPSAPLVELLQQGLIEGRVLDYGCGRGDDLRHLHSLGFEAEGWDPNPDLGMATRPEGRYDTVLCTYVLNTLPESHEVSVLNNIRKLLTQTGAAYIAVRRDVRKDGTGTQRLVFLNLEKVATRPGRFAIYEMMKWR